MSNEAYYNQGVDMLNMLHDLEAEQLEETFKTPLTMPDNTVDDIIKNGTKDYCSPLYAAEMYAKGLCPLADVEAAIRSAMTAATTKYISEIEERDKKIESLEKVVYELKTFCEEQKDYLKKEYRKHHKDDYVTSIIAQENMAYALVLDKLTPSKDNKKGE